MEAYKEDELCFPHLFNASCKKPTHNHSAALLFYSLTFLSVYTTLFNILVVISISHFRQLHTTTNLTLLSLAVSDFLVGLVVMPGEIIQAETCWVLGDLVCALYYLLPFIIICASAACMVLISIDRYVAICHPLHYASKFTLKTVKVSVCMCWTYAVLVTFLIFHQTLTHPGKFRTCVGECLLHISGNLDLVFSFVIPISLIIVLYLRVFLVAISQARAMRSRPTAVTLQRSKTVTVRRSELKAARSLGIVVAVFLMCYCPYYCVFLSGGIIMIGSKAETLMAFLLYSNSTLNPLIYAFCYPWFRKTSRLIVTLKVLAPGSRNTNVL